MEKRFQLLSGAFAETLFSRDAIQQIATVPAMSR